MGRLPLERAIPAFSVSNREEVSRTGKKHRQRIEKEAASQEAGVRDNSVDGKTGSQPGVNSASSLRPRTRYVTLGPWHVGLCLPREGG